MSNIWIFFAFCNRLISSDPCRLNSFISISSIFKSASNFWSLKTDQNSASWKNNCAYACKRRCKNEFETNSVAFIFSDVYPLNRMYLIFNRHDWRSLSASDGFHISKNNALRRRRVETVLVFILPFSVHADWRGNRAKKRDSSGLCRGAYDHWSAHHRHAFWRNGGFDVKFESQVDTFLRDYWYC